MTRHGPAGPEGLALDPIYLDHNATTPLDPEAMEAMRPYWLAPGNAVKLNDC